MPEPVLITFIKIQQMKEQLFTEFPKVSPEQWKQQIVRDLKGADYEESLIYHSPDGVTVKPFYTSDDIKGCIPFPPPKTWNICERIFAEKAEEGNTKALIALEKGVESIWFVIASEKVAPEVLLKGLELKQIKIFFNLQFLSEDYCIKLNNYLSGKSSHVYLQNDILSNLARSGKWFFNSKKDIKVLKSQFNNLINFCSVVSVDTSLYQNAGANIPQQLGYALAHLNEYLNILNQQGYLYHNFIPQFIVSTGGNYFFEIAKIRALRRLYSSLAKEYDLKTDCIILTQPTKRDKTLYDFNVNLLRTTIQSMSAVLGGADIVSNIPYDNLFHKSREFGERIARNQMLIMKHEANLDKVINAADGAYYIEHLTWEFSEAALEIFKQIEREGGYLKHLERGILQEQIRESAEIEQDLFDRGELVLVGTNKFGNPEDKMLQELEINPFYQQIEGVTVVNPIPERRLSENQEREKLKKESTQS